VKPSTTLNERIASLGDEIAQFADPLDPTDKVSSIFRSPSLKHIHVIVRRQTRESASHRLDLTWRNLLPLRAGSPASEEEGEIRGMCPPFCILALTFTDDRKGLVHTCQGKGGTSTGRSFGQTSADTIMQILRCRRQTSRA
jgi:hypothetical protein